MQFRKHVLWGVFASCVFLLPLLFSPKVSAETFNALHDTAQSLYAVFAAVMFFFFVRLGYVAARSVSRTKGKLKGEMAAVRLGAIAGGIPASIAAVRAYSTPPMTMEIFFMPVAEIPNTFEALAGFLLVFTPIFLASSLGGVLSGIRFSRS